VTISISEIFMMFGNYIGRQEVDDCICGCVVNSSWGWE